MRWAPVGQRRKGDLFEFEISVPSLAVQEKIINVIMALQYSMLIGAAMEQAVPSPEKSVEIQGHTDNTGTEDFNMKLSEKRAASVRDYLVAQGLTGEAISATGLGEADPVAENTTVKGRQKNRRVEIIVSGAVIGTQIGATQ